MRGSYVGLGPAAVSQATRGRSAVRLFRLSFCARCHFCSSFRLSNVGFDTLNSETCFLRRRRTTELSTYHTMNCAFRGRVTRPSLSNPSQIQFTFPEKLRLPIAIVRRRDRVAPRPTVPCPRQAVGRLAVVVVLRPGRLARPPRPARPADTEPVLARPVPDAVADP